MLGVSRANLTRVTRELLAAGLIAEGATELRASTGRPSELLELVPDARHFMGVKLTGDTVYVVVVDLSWRVVFAGDWPIRSRQVEDVVHEIGTILSAVEEELPDIAGLGVSLAGSMSEPREHRVVHESVYLGWDGVPLADLIAADVGLPTTVENDVQALTLAESLMLADSVAGVTLALVTVGVGIGVGYVIDGALVAGAHGRPGRIDHTIVDPDGPACDRGHRGCVSSYLASSSIVRNSGSLDYASALDAARRGDRRARRAFDDAGRALGVVIATVVNSMDPGRVILTGDGLALYEISSTAIEASIRRTVSWDAGEFVLDVRPFDFSEWARAAGIVAVEAALAGRQT